MSETEQTEAEQTETLILEAPFLERFDSGANDLTTTARLCVRNHHGEALSESVILTPLRPAPPTQPNLMVDYDGVGDAKLSWLYQGEVMHGRKVVRTSYELKIWRKDDADASNCLTQKIVLGARDENEREVTWMEKDEDDGEGKDDGGARSTTIVTLLRSHLIDALGTCAVIVASNGFGNNPVESNVVFVRVAKQFAPPTPVITCDLPRGGDATIAWVPQFGAACSFELQFWKKNDGPASGTNTKLTQAVRASIRKRGSLKLNGRALDTSVRQLLEGSASVAMREAATLVAAKPAAAETHLTNGLAVAGHVVLIEHAHTTRADRIQQALRAQAANAVACIILQPPTGRSTSNSAPHTSAASAATDNDDNGAGGEDDSYTANATAGSNHDGGSALKIPALVVSLSRQDLELAGGAGGRRGDVEINVRFKPDMSQAVLARELIDARGSYVVRQRCVDFTKDT